MRNDTTSPCLYWQMIHTTQMTLPKRRKKKLSMLKIGDSDTNLYKD